RNAIARPMPRVPPETKTVTSGAAAARRPGRPTGSRPSRAVWAPRGRLPPPSTTRARGGRAAPSAARRNGGPHGSPVARLRAHGPAPGSDTRNAQSPARRGRRRRRGSALPCRAQPSRYRRRVRRIHAVDLMLLGTVLLWALNSTVTRYVLTHGFHP